MKRSQISRDPHPLFLCSPAAMCEVNRSPPTFAPTKGPKQLILHVCAWVWTLSMHVCIFTRVGAHVCVNACGGQRSTSVSSSITLSLTHKFSLEPRTHCFSQPACSGHGLSLPPEHWACRLAPCLLGIYMGDGDLSLRLL